jgi:hypothetical protein
MVVLLHVGHTPGLGHCRVLVVALLVHGHVVVGHALLGDEDLFAAVDHKVAALPQSHTEYLSAWAVWH